MKEFNGPWIHFILHFIRKKYNLDNILSSCSQLSASNCDLQLQPRVSAEIDTGAPSTPVTPVCDEL